MASVVCRVSVFPSRWTVSVTGPPGLTLRISLVSCVQVATGTPLSDVTLSPTFSPASAAGDLASPAEHAAPSVSAFWLDGTQDATVPSCVVLPFSIPMPSARPKMRTAAITKCMNDPAASTISRCQPGARRKDRASSSGSTSSIEVIPTILTKPPTGSALMPYSVSPRWVDHSVGPNPTKYLVHFMPNRLAITKCPVSCSITETSRATRKISQPSASNFANPPITSRRYRAPLRPGQLPCAYPRPGVHREHVVERGRTRTRRVAL